MSGWANIIKGVANFAGNVAPIVKPVMSGLGILGKGIGFLKGRKAVRDQIKEAQRMTELGEGMTQKYEDMYESGDITADLTQAQKGVEDAIMDGGSGMAGRIASAQMARALGQATQTAERAGGAGNVQQAIVNAVTARVDAQREEGFSEMLRAYNSGRENLRMARKTLTEQSNVAKNDRAKYAEYNRDQGVAYQNYGREQEFAGKSTMANMWGELGEQVGGTPYSRRQTATGFQNFFEKYKDFGS